MLKIAPKRKAREEIKKKLQDDINKAIIEVRSNTFEINRLTEKQQILKRKVTELYYLIKVMEKL